LRIFVLTVALLFTAGLGVLTAIDLAHYGVTIIDVLAVMVVVLFAVGIVGALRHPPPE
jgi:hypothetical protein